jgi:hypothetical protein
MNRFLERISNSWNLRFAIHAGGLLKKPLYSTAWGVIELVEALGFQPDKNKRQPEEHGN